MKIFISVDMEGASGVTDPGDVQVGGDEYARCREFMTGDANAALQGGFGAGATEIVVNDSHWGMRNLRTDLLDPRARHFRGSIKPLCMVQGLDSSHAAALFVGYHACAGTACAVLDHTLLGKEIQNVYLNGEIAGETRINAAIAGELGVPVAFVAGDQAVCDEATNLLGDQIFTVAVKDAVDKMGADLLHPQVAQERIADGAAKALANLSDLRPYVIDPPIAVRFDWSSTSFAANAAMVPGSKRVGPRSTEYVGQSMEEVSRVIWVWSLIAMQLGQRTGVSQDALVYH